MQPQPTLEVPEHAHIAAQLRHLAVPIASIHADGANARQHDTRNLDAIKASLARFGQRSPLVVQRQGMVVRAGNGRLDAARALGWTHIAVIVVDESGSEATAFAIADNRTAELATWDETALAKLLSELAAEDEELAYAAGYDADELDDLLATVTSGAGGAGEDPGPQEPSVVAVSQRGELYVLGPHRLLCGDSTVVADVVRLMGSERAVMLATDPPYLVDYDGTNHPQSFERETTGKDNNKGWDAYKDPDASVEFFAAFLRVAIEHALSPSAAFYQWHASRRQALVEAAWKENGLLVHQQIVWVKARPILTRSHFMWQHEPCFYGWVEGHPPALRPPCGGEATTVWTIDQKGEQDGIHPTQKPLAIFERPIGYHTKPGDIVLEPFCGSGSQLIAAAKLGRRCFAMELAPEFCDAIRRRWTKFARSAGIDPGPHALEALP